MVIAELAIIVVLSYLLGAIPCGLIVSKVVAGIDVRNYGSGKIGGTNVLRTVGRKAGIMVMALDVAKDNISRLRNGTERKLGDRAEELQ